MVRNTRLTAKAQIGQHQTISRQQGYQREKILVTMIHGQPVPDDDLSQTIQYPAHFQSNRPTAFIAVLGADLLRRASCPNGKQQLNRKTVHHIQQTGISQQLISPDLVPSQLAQQRGAIRQPTEQPIPIALEPAVESSKVSTFQRKQDTDGDHLARIQARISLLRQFPQSIIDSTKN